MKVILLGDSIRMGYQPVVAQKLAESAEVWGPVDNGGDSRNVLEHLDEWMTRRPTDVIHFNCGLHDLKLQDGVYQVPIEEYVRNLKTIVKRLQEETQARLIWASTTPVDDELHAKRDVDFARRVADVIAYNRAALEVVQEAGLAVNGLHEVIVRGGVSACLHTDGVHMSPLGYDLLADAVVSAISG